MKFEMKNLGVISEAKLALGNLTIICGENNTGKTYATYAIYGFLSRWRQAMFTVLKDEVSKSIERNSKLIFDLSSILEGKLNKYMESICDSYEKVLPGVLASEDEMFNGVKFKFEIENVGDVIKKNYNRIIKSGSEGRILANINKETDSSLLTVLISDDYVQNQSMSSIIDFVADALIDIAFSDFMPNVHVSSAERTGAAIFRNELDIARTRMIKAINALDSRQLKMNPFRVLQMMKTDYAWPVEDNVEYVRQLESIGKKSSEFSNTHPEIMKHFNKMIGGCYKVAKNKIYFMGKDKKRFSMNEASSSIRSLLDIGFYLKNKSKTGDLFIIDEPELNLHPKNQRAFARLIAQIVNSGIKVFVTTHSDYLIKEMNTLIMLNQHSRHTKQIQAKYGYNDNELLDPNQVHLYITKRIKGAKKMNGNGKSIIFHEAKITQEYGIEVSTFDESIDEMNSIQNEILFGEELK